MTQTPDRRPDGGSTARPIRALIVDDEPLARDCVRIALEREEDIAVVGECADGEQAIRAIRDVAPDLVFLDVQMPGVDGFEVLARVGPERMPAVVFVTAHDEHAVRAFEVHALDYVLKPFDDRRFADTVRHARRQLRAQEEGELTRRLAALLAEHRLTPGGEDEDAERGEAGAASGSDAERRGRAAHATRFLVRERDRIRFVRAENVDWFEGCGNYVRLHVGGESHLIRASLGGTLAQLDPTSFVRIHRSTIVNVERIREVQPWVGGDYIAILQDGTQLRVSRHYRDRLLRPTL